MHSWGGGTVPNPGRGLAPQAFRRPAAVAAAAQRARYSTLDPKLRRRSEPGTRMAPARGHVEGGRVRSRARPARRTASRHAWKHAEEPSVPNLRCPASCRLSGLVLARLQRISVVCFGRSRRGGHLCSSDRGRFRSRHRKIELDPHLDLRAHRSSARVGRDGEKSHPRRRPDAERARRCKEAQGRRQPDCRQYRRPRMEVLRIRRGWPTGARCSRNNRRTKRP